jgi:ABC-type dipeptide/oligopeptide/nickel transport system permease subunit
MSVAEPTVPPARVAVSRGRRGGFLRTRRGILGLIILGFVVAVALIGPLVAPHPLTQPVGIPGAPPGHGSPLGTDIVGRDVLSRLLHGGFPVLWQSVLSVGLAYVVGVTVGMLAGLSRSWTDPVLMRGVDLLMVFPPLLLLLVLIAGAGSAAWVTIIGVAVVLFPGVARLVRTATLEVSTRGYVEAAVARGERTYAIMRREILPNIALPIIADASVRFLGAIFLVASLNFLGVGSQPPAANWGLMIAENRPVIGTNLWSVLAPALMLALLTISVNLIGDAYAATRGRSGGRDG